ncbi:MAG TPA: hypothetical protein VNO50_05965 [Pyrinomonadaceae bacterium]|nr:hypothetical protein [Pyrinomonadaceae bacterium]
MDKLIRIENSQIARFQGYINAAQRVFKNGELNVALEATLFEITDERVTDEGVVSAAYDSYNPIELRSECTIEEMMTNIDALLTIKRSYWKPPYWYADYIENDLREGYWKYLEECFDYKHARVVELGDSVPYVEMGRGVTYILYAPDMSRCLLLVGNESD